MVATEPPNNIDGVSETATGIRPVRIFVALRISPDIALALAQYGRDLEQFSVVLWRRPIFISRWCRHGMRFRQLKQSRSFAAWSIGFARSR